LTDGHSFILLYGNPTRNTGKFYRVCFGSEMDNWVHKSIDSRDCALPNKTLIAEWIAEYGLTSDFVRARVLGLPPTADELQFIDLARIRGAQEREIITFADEPLIAGFDASGGGSAWNVVRFRRGMDARTREPIRVAGELSRDREMLIAKLAAVMADEHPARKVTMMFVDSAYGSPYVERLHVLGYANVIEVNFGSPSPDPHQLNMRSFMWNLCRDWLPHGAIPTEKADEKLAADLAGPGARIKVTTNKLVLESKAEMQKRGQASPDDGDALCLTFAQPVAPITPEPEPDEEEYLGARSGLGQGGWMR
jgi:hypothetical protein